MFTFGENLSVLDIWCMRVLWRICIGTNGRHHMQVRELELATLTTCFEENFGALAVHIRSLETTSKRGSSE